MDEPSVMEVLDEMERTGGGFVQALAAAWYRADEDNAERLRTAFPEYWHTYRERVLRKAAAGNR